MLRRWLRRWLGVFFTEPRFLPPATIGDCSQLKVAYLLFNLAYRKFGWMTALLARLGLLTWVGRMARRLAYQVD